MSQTLNLILNRIDDMDSSKIARPLYEQRLERAFRLDPLLDYIENVINESVSESEDDCDSDSNSQSELIHTKDELKEDRSRMYNFSCIRKKRQWLKEVLLSSSDSEDDRELNQEDLQAMLHEHKLRKKYSSAFYQKEENKSYLYYSSGLLSTVDRYPEHQKYLAGSKRKKNREKKDRERQLKFIKEEDLDYRSENSLPSTSRHDDSSVAISEDTSEDLVVNLKGRSKVSKKDKKPKKLDAQALAIRRHKLWVLMAKKEVGRCQKSKSSFRKEILQNCKKMATGCMRFCRHKALQSQKTVKDKVWVLKRLTRTMQTEWKKFDRIMKEQNKRAEKEAEEQRKIDKEILEAKRQQRKVNFLITLPELYAHFMKNKMVSENTEDNGANSILKQLEDDSSLPTSANDDYDSESMKAQALKTAQEAYSNQQSRVSAFTHSKLGVDQQKEHSQPNIFVGQLKSYQLKGMNWLANLYYFGINGILADEMGLGKTVQSVAFLAHICEEYDTWGPFLIITPASTLHNWTGEITRFVPHFKVVPYWGNPEERKNLRKFFDGKDFGSEKASFHVVVTSYQIVIQDFKFLNRLKWNYMILDEAQAIKSVNSQRWKQLLGFSCRNRLLLSGTPIQNSMVELWALLHFIMPTLFDSHSWFNEWFSKDIEGHVENKTAVDEKHLNRLHTILKPFMLRRVKTEVENELSDKIEIMMYCPLTLRQKFLYEGLKNKISIDELLRTTMSSQSQQSVTTSLMNLVMQFRKVCNHPELLERREVKSPLVLSPHPYILPKLIYREGLLESSLPNRNHLIYNKFSIFSAHYIHSTFNTKSEESYFSFLRFIDTDISDVVSIAVKGLIGRCLLIRKTQSKSALRHHRRTFSSKENLQDFLLIDGPTCPSNVLSSVILKKLIFVSYLSANYSFKDHFHYFVPESLNHRLMRLQKTKHKVKIEEIDKAEDEFSISHQDEDFNSEFVSPKLSSQTFSVTSPSKSLKRSVRSPKIISIKKEEDDLSCNIPYEDRKPILHPFQPTCYPSFVLNICPTTHSIPRDIYSYDRSSAIERVLHERCSTAEGLSCVLFGVPELEEQWTQRNTKIHSCEVGGLFALKPVLGWNRIIIPDKHSLIMDAGKLYVLDTLLSRLKNGNHRVLIYSQMTKMIDLLEEYMWHRKHKYMRLDGSSKISDRRDMVEDFQNRSDIFVFLLSTRAGGVGINLTAADTVIFYDSDWNPTVDQQAMDRAHRLGQTKQVTVYRLICKSTIEERILQRAREKSEIQRMVISGGHFKPDTLKPKEVVCLLLEEDIEKQYRARQKEKRAIEDHKLEVNREKMRERMRKRYAEKKLTEKGEKKRRIDEDGVIDVCGDDFSPTNSRSPSPNQSETDALTDDGATPTQPLDQDPPLQQVLTAAVVNLSRPSDMLGSTSTPPVRGQRKRGRPRGSALRGRTSRSADGSGPGNGQFPDGNSSNNSGSVGSDVSNGSTPPTLKRGRGRPRLLPLGPGHQGIRSTPALPVALQGSLPSQETPSASSSTNSPFKFYS